MAPPGVRDKVTGLRHLLNRRGEKSLLIPGMRFGPIVPRGLQWEPPDVTASGRQHVQTNEMTDPCPGQPAVHPRDPPLTGERRTRLKERQNRTYFQTTAVSTVTQAVYRNHTQDCLRRKQCEPNGLPQCVLRKKKLFGDRLHPGRNFFNSISQSAAAGVHPARGLGVDACWWELSSAFCLVHHTFSEPTRRVPEIPTPPKGGEHYGNSGRRTIL